jgi:hypothetical protein
MIHSFIIYQSKQRSTSNQNQQRRKQSPRKQKNKEINLYNKIGRIFQKKKMQTSKCFRTKHLKVASIQIITQTIWSPIWICHQTSGQRKMSTTHLINKSTPVQQKHFQRAKRNISNQKLNPKEKHNQFINLHISYINLHKLLGDLQTDEFERIGRNRMVLEQVS